MKKAITALAATLATLTLVPTPDAEAVSPEHRAKAEAMIDGAVGFLRAQQDEGTGGWAVPPAGQDRPVFPGITALVINGMLMSPDISFDDPSVERGVSFILSHQNPDGGIYDRILPAYNTALSLSALARVRTAEAGAAIPPAREFLKSLQWSEDAASNPTTGRVTREHPFYGGIGYGGSTRPDNSNLNLALQGLRDAGVSSEDPVFQRALVFLQRTQMLDSVNDMPYADGSEQGGFIYATSPTGDELGVGESKAGTFVETLSDGTEASRLRAYGSMTYAGFKSYLYADLPRDDERVTAALGWIGDNYTLDENPGIGDQGLYYYFVTFSRALDAWGSSEIEAKAGVFEGEMRWNLATKRVVPSVSIRTEDFGRVLFSALYTDEILGADRPVTVDRPDGSRHVIEFLSEVRSPEPTGDLGADGKRWADVRITVYRPTNWAGDLIDRLAELQQDDGSFAVRHPRWMEDNQVLITAYALLALQHAID